MDYVTPCVGSGIIDENGRRYRSIRHLCSVIGASRNQVAKYLKRDGVYKHNGKCYYSINCSDIESAKGCGVNINISREPKQDDDSEEYRQFLKSKDVASLPFEKFDFNPKGIGGGKRYAVALFSDAHIEETVKSSSVLGLNEYNVRIARDRIERYFVNLARCLNEDKVDSLIFASLGDTISGYIHEELSQCNELTPIEATMEAQNLIYNGLRHLCENTSIRSIKFVGIVGNHSRTTKKIQHANGYKLSYEWLMYHNVKNVCEANHMPIEFCIPESEMAIMDCTDGRRFIFIHGFQIKSGGTGTVCGIYPALNRLSMKWDKTFHQDKIYLGHFHSCISIPNATVNGSIIGFNTFALTNGFQYEEPAQMYEVYDSSMGLCLTRKIYCK